MALPKRGQAVTRELTGFPRPRDVHVGLSLTSHDNTALATAVFDNVTNLNDSGDGSLRACRRATIGRLREQTNVNKE